MKRYVVLGFLIFTICGCSMVKQRSSEPQFLVSPIEGRVLEELLGLLTPAFPPAQTTFIFRPNGPVGVGLRDALRRHGYAISGKRVRNGQDLSYAANFIAPENLLIGVRVGKLWRADRLYAVEDETNLVGVTPATIVHAPPTFAALERRVVKGIAKQSGPADGPSQCEQLIIEKGSLKANVQRALERCGLALGHWNTAPEGYLDDWTVQQRYELVVKDGVSGLLTFLEDRYQLAGSRRDYSASVDFEFIKEEGL